MLIPLAFFMLIGMLIAMLMRGRKCHGVKVVSANPRPPRVEWWRHTQQGKQLNWSKRGSPIDLRKVMCYQNLKKQTGLQELSNVKADQLKKHINPHKEEWQTPEKECHVTGRHMCGVKRLRWEAEPMNGAEPKRMCF